MHSTSYVLFSHVIHLFIHLALFEILTPPKKKKKPITTLNYHPIIHHHLKPTTHYNHQHQNPPHGHQIHPKPISNAPFVITTLKTHSKTKNIQ